MWMIFTSCRWSLYTVYPTGCYSYSPTSIKCKCIWSQNVAVVGVLRTSSRGTFARFPHSHIGVIMPMLETVRPSNRRRRRRRLVLGRRSEKPTVRPSPETDAAQRRVRQSIREYVLIWLLQQRLRAVSGPHWRLRCMQPLHGHGMAHGSCQTLITLTRRPLSVSRALHVLSSCVLCLAPPAVDLLEALDRCVCTRRACCLFAHVALLLLPLSLFLGVRAPSLSLGGFRF